MEFWEILLEIVLLLGCSTLAGIVFERLGQSAVIGYLLTGLILGPNIFGMVENVEIVSNLAELGVALLLFAIGLEFSWRRLMALGTRTLAAGVAQILGTASAVFLVARLLGLNLAESIALGAAISLSSTAIVLRVLSDRAELDSLYGRNSLAILLTQDLAVVPLILVVTALGRGDSAWATAGQFGISILLATALAVALWLMSAHLLPRLLAMASAYRTRDLPVLIAVTFCLGSMWASHALGLSPILGSFLAGMLLAESPFADQIRADVTPLQAAFVTLFFTSVGTLARLAFGRIPEALIMAVLIMLGKAVIVAAVLVLLRRSSIATAVATGLCLSQIGEFSFVLTELAFRLELLTAETTDLLIASSVVSLAATPYLVNLAPLAGRLLSRISGRPGQSLRSEDPEQESRVIVVGFGPAGQAVVDRLACADIPFVVLDLNPQTVATHRTHLPIEYGDATSLTILRHLGVEKAEALVITLPDPGTTRLIISQVRQLAPEVCVVARSRYHTHSPSLERAGATYVVDEEYLLGQSLAGKVGELLGKDC